MSFLSGWVRFEKPHIWIDSSQASRVAYRNLLISVGLFAVAVIDHWAPQGIAPYALITPLFASVLLFTSMLLLWRPTWIAPISLTVHAAANIFVMSTLYRSLYHPPDNAVYAVAFLSASNIYVLILQLATFATYQSGARLFGWLQYAMVSLLVIVHWVSYDGQVHPGTVSPRVVLLIAPLISVVSLSYLIQWRDKATMNALANQQEKERLMAMVSHEIRGQLQTTLSTGELLSTKVTDAMGKRALDRLTRVTLHLDRYLRDWVEFVRLDNPEMSVEEKRFNLVELVDQTVEEHQADYIAKGLVLSGPLWSALEGNHVIKGQNFLGDPVRLKQVLNNLLDNALKYTSSGSVRVSVTIPAEPQFSIAIHVTDTGPGIAAEQLQLVFEPFMRLGNKQLTSVEGSGLGLAIASRLMRRLGGSLDVSSELGRGSCFTMYLPHKSRGFHRR